MTTLLDSTALVSASLPILSAEQLEIASYVDTGKDNLIVQARAGTGKTFLIINCLPLMRGSIAIMQYGKAIADETRAKVAKAGIRGVDVSTFHALGLRIVSRLYPKTKLEGKGPKNAGYYKFDRIADTLEIPEYLRAFVKKTMSMAMQQGFGVAGLTSAKDQAAWEHMVSFYNLDQEIADDNVATQLRGRAQLILEGIRFAYRALNEAKKICHEVISFDEMLWLPLILNAPFPTYNWVCMDEAQDSNVARREMARRMLGKNSRLMAVGDPLQSIFLFTGASCDAIDIIQRDFDCKVFPMTQTFRCGKKIVELAKTIVPDYRAAPTNHDGEVLEMTEAEFNKITLVPGEDAIICRNTKPLVKTAYGLIKRGIPAHIEGREIGKGLLALVNRWQGIKTIPALMTRLKEYETKEISKLNAAKQELLAETLADKIETIFVIIDGLDKGATLADLRNKIDTMFSDTPEGERPATVTLMTAHRSKGREFNRVFGWGRHTLMPSKRAKQPHEIQQETNLIYVMITRAIKTYVDVHPAD